MDSVGEGLYFLIWGFVFVLVALGLILVLGVLGDVNRRANGVRGAIVGPGGMVCWLVMEEINRFRSW